MAISIFPSTAAEFVSNNFVVDMNDTSNNTADTGGVKQAGPYSISFSSGDSSFDVYLIDEDGNSVGYSNNTSIVASGLFSTVVIFGVAQDEVVSFLYQGSVNNADGEGDEPGAGAYLESISPSDLPSIDDSATVTGGNFGADTEITFESGATVLPAKNIVVTSSTTLVVTRPDGLIEDDAPYTVRAITTGVPQPTGTNANILTDVVTAGSDPTWVTTSPLNQSAPNESFSQTLEATDSDGSVADYSVTAGTITPGLSLEASTGILSGTPTTEGDFTFTVTATDDGGNSTDREFVQTIANFSGGTKTEDATHFYFTFVASDTFTANVTGSVEYLVVAGGGGGGASPDNDEAGGGGGAGGLLNGTATISSVGDYPVIVGAFGAGGNANSGQQGTNGGDSEFASFATAIGGGGGGAREGGNNGASGGSGGGGCGGGVIGAPGTGGSGTAGQGNDGSTGASISGGGGGGAGSAGGPEDTTPGGGLTFQAWADASGIGTGEFAKGGEGGFNAVSGATGGPANTGAGGGGAHRETNENGLDGRDGVVILRVAK